MFRSSQKYILKGQVKEQKKPSPFVKNEVLYYIIIDGIFPW